MKTTPYDEREVTEGLYRYAAPVTAWAALFAVLAIAGALLRDEPNQMADAAPAVVRLTASETAVAPFQTSSVREQTLRDAAVATHEALDPMGVGLHSTR